MVYSDEEILDSFEQYKDDDMKEFESFDAAVDNFFSQIESQKIDAKAMQKETASIRKLENVKKDHEQRIKQLKEDVLAFTNDLYFPSLLEEE